MNDFLEKLKLQAQENPILALGIAAALITTISKFVDSSASSKNAASWERETKRRDRKTKQ